MMTSMNRMTIIKWWCLISNLGNVIKTMIRNQSPANHNSNQKVVKYSQIWINLTFFNNRKCLANSTGFRICHFKVNYRQAIQWLVEVHSSNKAVISILARSVVVQAKTVDWHTQLQESHCNQAFHLTRVLLVFLTAEMPYVNKKLAKTTSTQDIHWLRKRVSL